MGLSQRGLADLLGIAKNTVARREQGVIGIDPEAAFAIRALADRAKEKPKRAGGRRTSASRRGGTG